MRLTFIGFGTVGQGLAQILLEKGPSLQAVYGFQPVVVAVSDTLKGAVYDPKGLDLGLLLEVVRDTGRVDAYPRGTKGWDSLQTIRQSNADVVIEVTTTDLETGEPAVSHCKAAFETGKHVATTNKGPLVVAYRELAQLAAERGVQFRFEGTVMSGTPTLRLAVKALAGAEIRRIRGILNGTTNFILTEMEAGRSYRAALQKAQELGYAEADPTADVEGWDAAGKTVILANVLMGSDLKLADVARQGITGLTPREIAAARAEGKRWKLIAQVAREGGRVTARVRPELLPLSDPLAGVGGVTNAITFSTDLLGEVTLVGPGAGGRETGFALLGDLLDIHLS
ncbi:MAG TPA: homoserine dehydrogenase [Anaerolineae bacterium]|nr:homoserine dehydrogenase [Anaerolineae bacterium]